MHARSVKRVAFSRGGVILVTCSHDAAVSVRIRHVPGKMDDYVFKVNRVRIPMLSIKEVLKKSYKNYKEGLKLHKNELAITLLIGLFRNTVHLSKTDQSKCEQSHNNNGHLSKLSHYL